MSDEETEGSDDDSGSFCRHGNDPVDCDILCAACGHRCVSHGIERSGCDGCACEGWDEPGVDQQDGSGE
jgi:hypothetical protein